MKVFVYEYVTAAFPDAAASLRAEGRAMLSAISEDLQAIPGMEVLTLNATALSFDELATQADYTLLIAPEFDGILERLALQVLSLEGRLLGPSPDAIRLTSDKLALHDYWLSHGIPTPRTQLWDGETAAKLQVIKPRDGAGSQATRRSDMPVSEDWMGELIAQDYVEGTAASVALLLGPDQIVSLLPTQQILSSDGRFHYLGSRIPLPECLIERAVTLAHRAVKGIPGLMGYVGVDLVIGDHDWAIEINPRLTTSYIGLRGLSETNLAEAMLQVVRGEETALRWTKGTVEMRLKDE